MKDHDVDDEVLARVLDYTDRLHELDVLKSCVDYAKRAVFDASPIDRRFHAQDFDVLVAVCVHPEYKGQPEEDWAILYIYDEPAEHYPCITTWKHHTARFGE